MRQRILYKKTSPYNIITVTENFDTRTLWTGQVRQTVLNRLNPQDPGLEYARKMLMAHLFVTEPARILILGLGGGSLPRILRQRLPGAHIAIVEIDEAMVEISQEYFGLQIDPGMEIIIDDAYAYVSRKQKLYDLVFVDTFLGERFDSKLATQKYIRQLKQLTTSSGLVAVNLFSGNPDHLGRISRYLLQEWETVLLATGAENYNILVYASQRSLTEEELNRIAAREREPFWYREMHSWLNYYVRLRPLPGSRYWSCCLQRLYYRLGLSRMDWFCRP